MVAAPLLRKAVSLSEVTCCTASATEEVGTSTITSTPSSSIHWRATFEPTSGLFWWSADSTSIGMSLTLPPKSSTAILAASTEPGPDRSE